MCLFVYLFMYFVCCNLIKLDLDTGEIYSYRLILGTSCKWNWRQNILIYFDRSSSQPISGKGGAKD